MSANNSDIVRQLYALIAETSASARLFEEMCLNLLIAMGFKDVYHRKGTEQGRDIDASFAGYKWFFECKLTRADVDTASFAYKFLQLDSLSNSHKPDFFILLSNGSIKSILKDIIEFKKADKYTRYEVDIWANHDSNRLFDDIVLSNVHHISGFLLNSVSNCDAALVKKLEKAGREHIRKNGDFRNRLMEIPVLRNRVADELGETLPGAYALENTLSRVRDLSPVGFGFGPALMMIGVPLKPRYGLIPCSPMKKRLEFAKHYLSWGLRLEPSNFVDSILFREIHALGSTFTLMCSWGAVVTLEPIAFGARSVIQPFELFPLLKEHAVRFRNYLKRGVLVTPCALYAVIEDLELSAREHLLGTGDNIREFRFRRLARAYLGEITLEIQSSDITSQSPVMTAPITLSCPVDDYSHIGGLLSHAIWKEATGEVQLLTRIRKLHAVLLKRWEIKQKREDWNKLVELRKGFDYLLDTDLFHRPYDIFNGEVQTDD